MDLKEVKAIRDSQEAILILMMWKDRVDWLITQAEKVEQLQQDIQEWEQISEKQVGHLIRNGKEIMKLTEENERLTEKVEQLERRNKDLEKLNKLLNKALGTDC